MDLAKPLRSELGKENLYHVNGGGAYQAPAPVAVQVFQQQTFSEDSWPEATSKHEAQETAQEAHQTLSLMLLPAQYFLAYQ